MEDFDEQDEFEFELDFEQVADVEYQANGMEVPVGFEIYLPVVVR